MNELIIEVSYEQERMDFFLEQKRVCERKLHWWSCQKPYKQYAPATIQENCSRYGQKIAFYEDAIEKFGG